MLSGINIYVINLERSPHRKDFMEKQFTKYGITNYKFVKAVDGKKVSNLTRDVYSDNSRVVKYNYDKNVTEYELACMLSHLVTIKNFLDTNNPYCLILEDDVTFDFLPHWKSSVQDVINFVETQTAKDPWNIISLFDSSSNVNYSVNKYRPIKDWSTASYIINRKGAKILMDAFYDTDNEEYDLRTVKLLCQPIADIILPRYVNWYIYAPTLFTTKNNSTTLSSTIHKEYHFIQKGRSVCHYKTYYDLILTEMNQQSVPKVLHILLPKTVEDHPLKDFIEEHYSDWTIKYWRYLDMNDKTYPIDIAAQLFAYQILYNEGGIYIPNQFLQDASIKPKLLASLEKSRATLLISDISMNQIIAVAAVKNHSFLKYMSEFLPYSRQLKNFEHTKMVQKLHKILSPTLNSKDLLVIR
jgi:GR25 family glycosyltransferase involved in LPS biosynthesis